MVFAPFFLAGRRRGCRYVFLERTFRARVETTLALRVRTLLPVVPALFSDRSPGASALPAPRPAAAWTMTELPSSARPHALNATRTIRSHCLARFSRSEGAQNFQGKNARFRCLERPAECSFWNPSGSDRRDPNTLAPNGIKLGRLRYARQGLVRVPESNTKYGGKPGKTGAPPSRCWGASISESSGIPKRKNSTFPGHFRPCPTVHREDLLWALPLLQADSKAGGGQACGPVDGLVPREAARWNANLISLFEHDLGANAVPRSLAKGKPVSTSPDHALAVRILHE